MPLGQSSQLSGLETNFPAGHGVQLVLPDELEMLPLGQFSHTLSDAKVPGEQVVQVALPAADTLPLAHAPNAVVLMGYCPA